MTKTTKFLIFFVTIIIIITGLIVGADYYVERKIQDYLDSDSHSFVLELVSFNFHPLSRTISGKNITFRDSSIYINSSSARIEGIALYPYLMSKEVMIDKIMVDSIAMIKYAKKKKAAQSDRSPKIDHIEITYAVMADISEDDMDVGKFKSSSFTMIAQRMKSEKVKIYGDSISLNIELNDNLLPISGIIKTGYFRTFTKDGLYEFTVESSEMDIDSKIVDLSGLTLSPLYSKNEFVDKNGYRKGRVNLAVKSVELNKINIEELMQNSAIVAEKLRVVGGDCNVFLNLNKPKNKTKERKIISQFLHEIPIDIQIDTVETTVSYVKLELPNKKTGKIGSIDFKGSYLSAYHVSNRPGYITKNPKMDVDIVTKFMGEGKVNSHFSFELRDSLNYAYRSSGNLQKMDIQHVNTILIPIANLNITSGMNQSFVWDFEGGKKKYTGELEFAYEQLELEVLGNDQKEKKVFKSLLADLFVLNKNNQLNSEDFVVGRISTLHDDNSSFFSNLWTALESGIITTIISGDRVQDRFLDRIYGEPSSD